MERISLVSMLLVIGLMGFAQTLLAQPQTAEQKLKNAMSAGSSVGRQGRDYLGQRGYDKS